MPKLAILLDCYPGEHALIAYVHGEPMLHLLHRITHRLLSSKRDIDHSTGMLLVNGRPIDDYHKPVHLCFRQRGQDKSAATAVVVSYFAVRRPTIDIHIHIGLDLHRTMALRTTSSSTLGELKTLIMYLKGIPQERQSCFIFEGRRLADNSLTLGDYGVRDSCRLHLILVAADTIRRAMPDHAWDSSRSRMTKAATATTKSI